MLDLIGAFAWLAGALVLLFVVNFREIEKKRLAKEAGREPDATEPTTKEVVNDPPLTTDT